MENQNNNYLFELIQDIQSKLNTETSQNSNDENNNDTSNCNISDILNNLNLSSIFGKNDSGIDINTFTKIQKILTSMNKNDPRKNLLISLKPFLRESRQEKINEYLTYLSIGNALGIFEDKGSEKDVT